MQENLSKESIFLLYSLDISVTIHSQNDYGGGL